MMLVLDITFRAHDRAIVSHGFMNIANTLGWRQVLMLPYHHRLHTSFALLRRELTTIRPFTQLNGLAKLLYHFWCDTCQYRLFVHRTYSPRLFYNPVLF